jgi:hypothetical protein
MEVSGQLHALAALCQGKSSPVPIGWEARCAQDLVWMIWRREKSYTCQQSNPGCPAQSLFLYRLSYPGFWYSTYDFMQWLLELRELWNSMAPLNSEMQILQKIRKICLKLKMFWSLSRLLPNFWSHYSWIFGELFSKWHRKSQNAFCLWANQTVGLVVHHL